MPRVRLAAGKWSGIALAAAILYAAPAPAAPPGSGRGTGAPAPAAVAGPRPAEAEARRRDEIDALQRQDAAEALKKHFNIEVDWRTTPLARMVDIRVRAAKAAELQLRLGVTVDWQRYSWIELEALRRTLLSFERYRDQPAQPTASIPASREPLRPPSDDGLVRPTFKARPAAPGARSTDPDGVMRPTFSGRSAAPVAVATDPDGVIRPTFVVRPRWSAFGADPDGLIAPTFVPFRRVSSLGDADDLIDPTETHGGRTVPARW
jgi:hypothetical protein